MALEFALRGIIKGYLVRGYKRTTFFMVGFVVVGVVVLFLATAEVLFVVLLDRLVFAPLAHVPWRHGPPESE